MIGFIVGNENEVINNQNSMPKTAFAIIESKRGYMLVYNKYFKHWELTGGMMGDGETPRDCAIRECKEESNQNIADLKFIGVAKYSWMNAALYYTFLNNEEPFIENEEISGLLWWKPGKEVAESIDDESIKMIELFNSAV